jgi:putative hydrolase of the HAD superfamily
MTLSTILFDLGGTLLNYYDPLNENKSRPFQRVTLLGVQAVITKLAQTGAKLPDPAGIAQSIDRHVGTTYRAVIEHNLGGSIETPVRAALAEMGVDLAEGDWLAVRPLLYEAIDGCVSPRVGVHETLTRLRDQGYALGLISNTFWAADVHDRHLVQYGLIDLLPVRIYSCETPTQKPDPGIFKLALNQIGAEASTSIYVGDRLDADVAGAQGIGMKGVLIRSEYMDQTDTSIQPDAIIHEIPDLLDVLERWKD